jgi:hypothetical protein
LKHICNPALTDTLADLYGFANLGIFTANTYTSVSTLTGTAFPSGIIVAKDAQAVPLKMVPVGQIPPVRLNVTVWGVLEEIPML